MKKKTRVILSVVLLIVAIVSLVYIIYYVRLQKERRDAYADIQKQVIKPVEQELESVPKEQSSKEENPINFKELTKQNPDIYAWITIPNTPIEYPVVQSPTDNSYYLNHTVERQEGLPGSIYTENYNTKKFSDFNTLIYGHDMIDGSMFQALHNYSDMSYFQQHPYVYIYTPEKKFTYEIFHSVVYDDRHIMLTYDFTKDEQRQSYLDSLQTVRDLGSNFKNFTKVDAQSRIITMSTCLADRPNNRFLVGAVLIDEYKYTGK